MVYGSSKHRSAYWSGSPPPGLLGGRSFGRSTVLRQIYALFDRRQHRLAEGPKQPESSGGNSNRAVI
jgi:hypothetical protein